MVLDAPRRPLRAAELPVSRRDSDQHLPGTRGRDGEELMRLAPAAGIATEIEPYSLEAAGEALGRLRAGEVRGAAVLAVDPIELAGQPTRGRR